jgi:hypothetical protein
MASNPAEKDNVITLPMTVAQSASEAPVSRRLGLSKVDTVALRLLSGENAEVTELARGYAEALAGPDGGGARVRLLSRVAATLETKRALLEGAHVAEVLAGNAKQAQVIERALASVTSRLCQVLSALHHEQYGHQRSAVVAIGITGGNVTVGKVD